MRRKRTREGKEEEKTKERKNNGSKKDSRRIRDLEWGGRSSKIQRRDQEIGFSKVLQVDPHL